MSKPRPLMSINYAHLYLKMTWQKITQIIIQMEDIYKKIIFHFYLAGIGANILVV